MKITKKCKTCESTFIIIDDSINTLTCGVKGIIDAQNVRIVNGEISCAKCNALIHKE